MKHITIKRAEQADVDAIMQLMQEAVDTVKVSDWFLPDNRQYIEEHISDRGFTLKALSSNNEILGFFIVDLPEGLKHNIYSRTNFVKAGYREARQMSKYGGMQRIIMEKEK